HLDLHAFPTRRSSDLTAELERHLRRLDAEAERLRQAYAAVAGLDEAVIAAAREKAALASEQDELKARRAAVQQRLAAERARRARSEEHTSELQSRENL